jgi:fatty-acyl-CoA synthase
VLEVAVVGVPDPKWGEVPVAVVEPRAGVTPNVDDLTAHVRQRLAGFKVPRQVRFAPLPRTSTGKVRKDLVRRMMSDQRSEVER